jgi:branched-chain amino acid transport system ATP-binding protein
VSALLRLENVSVRYGKAEAVKGVSLDLPKGGIVTVIGPNGAGKTTLLNAAMGLLPSSGVVRFDGEDVSSLDIEERVERGLCLAPEKRELFGDMSILDNLRLGGFIHRRARGARELDAVFDLFPRLSERRRQRASTLSGGERQMLTLGRALMLRPRALMLDEPSLGLAPLIVREIFRAIAGLRAAGVSVLLVEQNARAALETAEFGYILETGEIAGQGAARTLLDDPRLIASYLGEAPHAD